MVTEKQLCVERIIGMIHQYGYRFVKNYFKSYGYLMGAVFSKTETGFVLQDKFNKRNKITITYHEPKEDLRLMETSDIFKCKGKVK